MMDEDAGGCGEEGKGHIVVLGFEWAATLFYARQHLTLEVSSEGEDAVLPVHFNGV